MLFSFGYRLLAFTLLCIVFSLTPNLVWNAVLWSSFFCCLLYASALIGQLLDQLPRFKVSPKNKAVFITGCDSGFGYLLAHRLDSLGYKVFAGCLSPTSEGASELRSSCSSKLMVVLLDVTDDDSVKKAQETVAKNLGGDVLWAVVNNAGILIRGELEWMPLEDYQKQFEVNTFGVVRVTKAFLPLLRQYKSRVVTIVSSGGHIKFVSYGAYCMSKHATSSFCDVLRMEMKKFGVDVISVEPFVYKTPMTKRESTIKSLNETWSKVPGSLKEAYGSNYIDTYRESVMKADALATNPNTHEVVDALVEAATAVSPHHTYAVGSFGVVAAFFCIARMPTWARDYVMRRFVAFDTDNAEFLKKESFRCIANGKKKL